MTNSKLRTVIQSFKCKEEEVKIASIRPTKVKKTSESVKSSSNYSNLLDLPPSIDSNLTLLFIGFNPGVESSRRQHHYAHPTNLFWKLFNALDVLSKVLKERNIKVKDEPFLRQIYQGTTSKATAFHDYDLVQFGIGFTDLVLRCTKTAQELSKEEKLDNVPRLFTEFSTSRSPWIVFVGKGIWEIVVKYLDPTYKLTKTSFSWGLQNDSKLVPRLHIECGYKPQIFVFPNTSGLVALMKYPEKLALWDNLAAHISTGP